MLLPEGTFIHYEVNLEGETTQVVAYIDESKTASFSAENSDAYLIGYMDDDEYFSITSLYSKEPGKRRGVAVLFLSSIFLSIHYPRIKYMILDDCSSVDPPRNVYYRLGFQVRDERTNRFIDWDTWIERYGEQLENPTEERRIRVPFSLQNINT